MAGTDQVSLLYSVVGRAGTGWVHELVGQVGSVKSGPCSTPLECQSQTDQGQDLEAQDLGLAAHSLDLADRRRSRP